MLGKIEGRRRRVQQRMRWLDDINGFNGHEFEQTLGESEGQGSLACCSPWGRKESDLATEQQIHRIKPCVGSQVSLPSCLHFFPLLINHLKNGHMG